MTPQDIEIVQKQKFREDPPPIITIADAKSEAGKQITGFCEELKQLEPIIKIKKDDDTTFKGPAMIIGSHMNIAYASIPNEKIMSHFLEAVNDPQDIKKNNPAYQDQLKKIDLPAFIKLYISGHCPHCPQTIRRVQALAYSTPLIRLQIISAELFPEEAQEDQVRSVPTLIMDDQFRWSGQVDIKELLEICANRDPSRLSADSLRQLIGDGDAARVANMMMESNQIYPGIIELLTHPRWSVRLGAMVTAEYLADENRTLALELCRMLWNVLPKLESQAQGDVVHLFGLVDDPLTKGYLKQISTGPYGQDAKDAAAEVLEEMADDG